MMLLFSASVSSTASATSCATDFSPLFAQGRDFFQRGQFLLASQQFSTVALLGCSKDLQQDSRLRWAQSLYELGEIQEGHLILSELKGTATWNKAQVIQGWYEPSLASTLEAPQKARFESWAKRDLSTHDIKLPWLAGSLSAIIPGAGQIYNGNYQSAAFGFLLNALFLSTTIDFHNRGLDAPAVTSGMLFSVVYLGNIVGSVRSAQKLNELNRAPHEEDLKLQLFPELTF